MALRDFDRVRERRVLRVERRHLAQAGLALTAVVGGAFYVGWQQGNQAAPPAQVTRVVVTAKTIAAAPLPLPRNVNDHRPPVLPTPVARAARERVLAERRAVPLAPVLEEAAGQVGRAAVASDRHEQRPRLDEATVESEHATDSVDEVERPPQMLGALPTRPMAAKRKTAKSVALREAFAEREDHSDGLHGEVPAEFVQSRAPVGGAVSVDPALTRGEAVPSFGLFRGVDSSGAAVQTPMNAGGFSLGQPAATQTAGRMNPAAQQRLVDAHLAKVALERQRQAAKLAAAQQAAAVLRRAKLAELAAAKAAKLAAAQAAAEAKARKLADIAAAKATKLAAQQAAQRAAKEAKARKLADLAAAKATKLAAQKAAKDAQLKRLAEAKAKKQATLARLAAEREVAAAAAKKKRAAQQAQAKRLQAQAQAKAQADKRALLEKRRLAKEAATKAQALRLAAAKQTRAAQVAKAAATKPTVKPKPVDTRMYWVQIKSLKDGAEAKAFAAGLRSKGYKLTLTVANVPTLGTFHRVRLGPFRGQANAKQAQQRFQKREGMEAMVMSANRPR